MERNVQLIQAYAMIILLRTEPATSELMGLQTMKLMDRENDNNRQQINGGELSLLLLSGLQYSKHLTSFSFKQKFRNIFHGYETPIAWETTAVTKEEKNDL